MVLNAVDWIIVFAYLSFLISVATFTRRYSRGVADFLAANRVAGRYQLCVAGGMAGFCVVAVVTQAQSVYNVGLGGMWWAKLYLATSIFLSLTGWIIYRFRETKALTLAQFFEIRYSRRFRVFTGTLAFVAGVINFGVFPAIGANFFIYYCGLPEHLFWGVETFYFLIILFLIIAVYFTLSGGQVTVITTDFIQGIFTNVVLVMIFIIIIKYYGIGNILDSLELAPAGQSRLNPVDIQGNKGGFNLWYFLLLGIMQVYGFKTWQADQGYNCSAKTPHEAKMAGILGSYRWLVFMGGSVLIPLCAYTIMHNPNYAQNAINAQLILDKISNPEIRNQMITPVVMRYIIPSGLQGLYAAAMLGALIGAWNTQLHSWGSIFVQDVIMPFRKTHLPPKTHLRWLKISVVMVAVFVFLFSCLFRQSQHFQIYAMVSGSVYIGGAGIVVIGGLYWKKGTTSAAWAAMITGASISIIGILLEQTWIRLYDKTFPVTFKIWATASIACSFCIYVLISLLSNKEFNMDKMLHRGKYSIKSESTENISVQNQGWFKKFMAKLGVTNEFTIFDKIIWWFGFGQTMFFFFYVLIITIIYLKVGFSIKTWKIVHAVWLWWVLSLIVPISLWLGIFGIRDSINFFKCIKNAKQDDLDDGTVVNHQNLTDKAQFEDTLNRK